LSQLEIFNLTKQVRKIKKKLCFSKKKFGELEILRKKILSVRWLGKALAAQEKNKKNGIFEKKCFESRIFF
jgi:hypothetical protein